MSVKYQVSNVYSSRLETVDVVRSVGFVPAAGISLFCSCSWHFKLLLNFPFCDNDFSMLGMLSTSLAFAFSPLSAQSVTVNTKLPKL